MHVHVYVYVCVCVTEQYVQQFCTVIDNHSVLFPVHPSAHDCTDVYKTKNCTASCNARLFLQTQCSRCNLFSTERTTLRKRTLGADKSLARPTCRYRRGLFRCRTAGLFWLQRLKGSMPGDAREFNTIEFGRCSLFPSWSAKDLSAPPRSARKSVLWFA